MLNISLPHIAVQKVSNGFVVQWEYLTPEIEGVPNSRKRKHKEAICPDGPSLLAVIETASSEVTEVTNSF